MEKNKNTGAINKNKRCEGFQNGKRFGTLTRERKKLLVFLDYKSGMKPKCKLFVGKKDFLKMQMKFNREGESQFE